MVRGPHPQQQPGLGPSSTHLPVQIAGLPAEKVATLHSWFSFDTAGQPSWEAEHTPCSYVAMAAAGLDISCYV